MKYAQLFLRLAVGTAFLSAVADRLGYWGPPGQGNVAWGNWDNFVRYTHQLNYFASEAFSRILAVVATILETFFGLMLIFGFRTKVIALLSAFLLLVFAAVMTLSLGIQAAFNYSVWVGACACLVLASLPAYPYSLDAAILAARSNKKNQV